jgi:hypothetical protein
MAAYINSKGETNQVPLEIGMYRAAFDNGMSFEQYINRTYADADPKHGPAFTQLLASEGIFLRPVKEYGVRASTMDEILNGKGQMQAGGTILKEGVPASRILFPAAYLSVIEDKLLVDLNVTPNAFEGMIAVDDSINNDRFDRPVLHYSRPEAARHQIITQLAMPNTMLGITASEVSRKIPTFSLGLEVSDQALKATTLDLVGLALARQAAVERNERAQNYISQMLNGDVDNGMAALSSISGKSVKASSFDSSLTVAGTLSQKAWISWLFKNHLKRKITHVVTDLATAMAIENRSGKPVVVGDNPTSHRIDAIPSIINEAWDFNTKIFLTDDPNWPANTIMGMDARYAIHRVKSLTATYEAVEQLVMRRSTQMRFDFGEIVYRLFDEAFEVMTLVP